MKKILIILMFWLVMAGSVSADERHAGTSAVLASNAAVETQQTKHTTLEMAAKRRAIVEVLKRYNSPMTQHADAFLKACVKYNMDCYLLPAIAGLESSFGVHIWPDSHNAFGWGGGYIMFTSWEEGIDAVAAGLAKNYIGQGLLGVDAIGPKYSASPTWAPRVANFMTQFENIERNDTLHSAIYSL
jgi:hypothetical protein